MPVPWAVSGSPLSCAIVAPQSYWTGARRLILHSAATASRAAITPRPQGVIPGMRIGVDDGRDGSLVPTALVAVTMKV